MLCYACMHAGKQDARGFFNNHSPQSTPRNINIIAFLDSLSVCLAAGTAAVLCMHAIPCGLLLASFVGAEPHGQPYPGCSSKNEWLGAKGRERVLAGQDSFWRMRCPITLSYHVSYRRVPCQAIPSHGLPCYPMPCNAIPSILDRVHNVVPFPSRPARSLARSQAARWDDALAPLPLLHLPASAPASGPAWALA